LHLFKEVSHEEKICKFAYYLIDESDCRDWERKELPVFKRIGFYSAECEKMAKVCRMIDPKNLTMILVDNTFSL